MKKSVTKLEVFDFKANWCNENRIITQLMKSRMKRYLIAPILDVGSGLGDIAFHGFPDKESICIDVNSVTRKEFPLAKKHRRKQVDFFNYLPEKPIHTVLISHTLQFLDEDISRLNKKIQELRPVYVILVCNDNTDFMGELVQWAFDHLDKPNPEVRVTGFPLGYSLKKKIGFKARLKCPNFDKLAQQISYLMVADLNTMAGQLIYFLKDRLRKAEFSFSQSIEIYAYDEQ